MSSYLTFYVVPKAEGSKPLSLICYSRNTHIYQYFDEINKEPVVYHWKYKMDEISADENPTV